MHQIVEILMFIAEVANSEYKISSGYGLAFELDFKKVRADQDCLHRTLVIWVSASVIFQGERSPSR